MTDLERGTTNSDTNPRVLFAWQSPNVGDSLESGSPPALRQLKGGFFQPISDLSFRVLRPDGSELIPPTVVDTSNPSNVLDKPANGGKGRIFVPNFTVPLGEPVGMYMFEATFIADPADGGPIPSQTLSFPFRVIDEAQGLITLPGGPNFGGAASYVQLVDMLSAGFPIDDPAPVGGYSFADARRAILEAIQFFDDVTGRFFSPRYREFDLDGDGGPAIQTEHVIVGLTDVTFTFTTFTPADLPIEEGDLRVYNRHIRQGLEEPDDRDDPRVEFLRTPVYRFPRSQLLGEVDILSSFIGFTDSQQNVKMRGMWGYTDPDGSPFGKTPERVKEAILRLAARNIQPLWQRIGGAGSQSGIGGPILEEKTMDQSVKFSDVASSEGGLGSPYAGVWTGDPAIDQIIALYLRPPRFRSA